jgi:predicted O-methyltransferase YrrM
MQRITWTDGATEPERWQFKDTPFEIDGVEYVSTMSPRTPSSPLCVKKPPALVEAVATLLAGFQQANIVELGISQGGSTALMAQLGRPRKLVALELSPEPVTELQDFIDASGMGDNVRPYYGVDQSDRERVTQILDHEFGDEPLDLVLDDASHLLELTRTSFEVLFPRLRPGGLFVLEDWNWQHLQTKGRQKAIREPGSPSQIEFRKRLQEALADKSSPEHAALDRWLQSADEDQRTSTPSVAATDLLTFLVIQLMFARAWSADAVARLDILDHWVVVHRGPAELDAESFRVADIAHDHFDVIGRLSSQPSG